MRDTKQVIEELKNVFSEKTSRQEKADWVDAFIQISEKLRSMKTP